MEERKYDTFSCFCNATIMEVSQEKSQFYCNKMDEGQISQISLFLPLKMEPLNSSFKYLGYHFKPNMYRKEDWVWLLKKFEKKIGS